jgi:hypothetical protein
MLLKRKAVPFFSGAVFCLLFPGGCLPSGRLQKGWAFSRTVSRGINGNSEENVAARPAEHTVHFIYLEISGHAMPLVDLAYLGDRPMSASVYPTAASDYDVGIDSVSGKNYLLHPAVKNSLWRVELTGLPATEWFVTTGTVLLKGRIGRKPFQYQSDKEIPLKPQDHY